MFRVRAVSVLTLGLLLIAASTQAQQPGPYMNGPMPLPQPGFGPQGMQGMPPQGPPMGFDPAYAQAMYEAPMMAPYGVAPAQYQGDMPQPIIAGDGYGGYGDCGCGGPCDGGCCQKGCGMPCDMPCCEPCPPDCCPAVCSFEVESTFLFADIKGTEAVGQLDAPAVPVGAIFFSEDAGLEDEVTASPRIWLHCQKCEWGVGVRYWNLDDSETAFTPLNLLQLNIIGDYRLERIDAEVGDVEVTYGWNHGHHYGLMSGTSFRLSVGGRYAEYENDSLILANGSFTDAIAHASAVAQNRFDGTGITSGARGTICLKHQVSLFWGVRGSLIWGDMTTLAQTAATAIYEVDPAAGQINSAGAETDEELFIGEAQLGFQCEHQLRCIPAVAFIRVAAEYQLWEIDSDTFAFAESAVQVDVIPPGESIIAASQAFAEAPKLDLYGITLSTGITW